MEPLLHQAPGLNDEDAMRVDDRRQPVGYDESLAAFHQRFQRPLDEGFVLGVER